MIYQNFFQNPRNKKIIWIERSQREHVTLCSKITHKTYLHYNIYNIKHQTKNLWNINADSYKDLNEKYLHSPGITNRRYKNICVYFLLVRLRVTSKDQAMTLPRENFDSRWGPLKFDWLFTQRNKDELPLFWPHVIWG